MADTSAPARDLTLKEVAARYGVTERTVAGWISRGELRAHRVGPKLIRVSAEDADALVKPIEPSVA